MTRPAPHDFVTPRFFLEQENWPCLQLDDVSFVIYRSATHQDRVQVTVTTNLFVVLLSGEKIIHTAEEDLRIGTGGAFFARSGSYLFSELLSPKEEYKTLLFFIDDSFLKYFLERHSNFLHQTATICDKDIFTIPVSPLLRAGLDSVLPYFLHPSGYSPFLLRLKLEELLFHIVEADTAGNCMHYLRSLYSSRKKELQSLMEQTFFRRLAIGELAALSGRSLSAFKREFAALFHESPGRWITNRRLEHARWLLSTSDRNVSEVCLEVGFDSFSHFSQAFKKKFGIPPSRLQKRLDGGT